MSFQTRIPDTQGRGGPAATHIERDSKFTEKVVKLLIVLCLAGSSRNRSVRETTLSRDLHPYIFQGTEVYRSSDPTHITNSESIRTQVWDGPYGNPYAGTYYHGNGCCEPLTAIEVFGTGSKVFGIQFSYGGVQKGRMGSPTGERFELRLEKDEVVTCVEGAGKEWLTKLVVRTNRGAVLAVGEVDSDGWRGEGSKLDDVSGFASGDAIHALSFAWSGGLLVRLRFVEPI